MDHVKAKNTKFVKADLGGADVSYIEIDNETLLLDANLRGAIGAEKMRVLQEEQHKLQKQWFGRSKYGHCKSNPDGGNDRFKCQRIGATLLSAAIGGGTGFTLAGPFAGVSAAAVSAFVGDKAVVAIKQGYYEDLGYINNEVGAKLAEIGAVAMAAGVNGVDRAIDGAAAGMICSAAGALTGVVATGVGAMSVLKGIEMMWSGYHNQSRWQNFTGAVLAAVGSALTFFGLSSMSASLSTVAYGALFGGAAGAVYSMVLSVRSLTAYKEKEGKVVSGLRPEQIYIASLSQLDSIRKKIMPTKQKLIVSLILGAVALGVAAFGAEIAITAIGGALLTKATIGLPVVITAAAAGAIGGYLYDDKVIDSAKSLSNKIMFKEVKHGRSVDTGSSDSSSSTKVKDVLQAKQEVKEVAPTPKVQSAAASSNWTRRVGHSTREKPQQRKKRSYKAQEHYKEKEARAKEAEKGK